MLQTCHISGYKRLRLCSSLWQQEFRLDKKAELTQQNSEIFVVPYSRPFFARISLNYPRRKFFFFFFFFLGSGTNFASLLNPKKSKLEHDKPTPFLGCHRYS